MAKKQKAPLANVEEVRNLHRQKAISLNDVTNRLLPNVLDSANRFCARHKKGQFHGIIYVSQLMDLDKGCAMLLDSNHFTMYDCSTGSRMFGGNMDAFAMLDKLHS